MRRPILRRGEPTEPEVVGLTAQAFHSGTLRTMFHIIPSSALSISSCGSVRVLVRPAQHIPLAVRAMMVVEPGKLPLCHTLPEPTIQPRAYLAAEVMGKTGQGIVMTWMVSAFKMLGIGPEPPTWLRN
jgi:hypothetical protein